MNTLKLRQISLGDELARPTVPEVITKDSPALSVMTDFRKADPGLIEWDTPIQQAHQRLQTERAQLKLVMDGGRHFLGLLLAEDISHQEIIRRVARGSALKDLCVGEFMRPRRELYAFEMEELKGATIREVVATLGQSEQSYCLVVDSERHEIRGVIAVKEIQKQLGIQGPAQSQLGFSQLFKELHPLALN